MLPIGPLACLLFRVTQPRYHTRGYLNEWYHAYDRRSSVGAIGDGLEVGLICRSIVTELLPSPGTRPSSPIESSSRYSVVSAPPGPDEEQAPSEFGSALESDTEEKIRRHMPAFMLYVTWVLVLVLAGLFSASAVYFMLHFAFITVVHCIESFMVSAFLGIVVAPTLLVVAYEAFYVYQYKMIDELYITRTDVLTDTCVKGKEVLAEKNSVPLQVYLLMTCNEICLCFFQNYCAQ